MASTFLPVALLCTAALATAGCGLIYKQDIEQGNVLEQKSINQLRPGMSKRQVELILGTPAHLGPFHNDQWQYLTSVKKGRRGRIETTQLTVYFESDRLVRTEGDYKPDPNAVAEPKAATPDTDG